MALDGKLHIVSPGMDPKIFKLSEAFTPDVDRFLKKVDHMIQKNGNGRQSFQTNLPNKGDIHACHALLLRAGERYDQRAIDADLPARWPQIEPHEPIILYFGKFLPAKGAGELLLTVPTVLSKLPQARFIFVGFGAYREHIFWCPSSLFPSCSTTSWASARSWVCHRSSKPQRAWAER